VKLCINCKHYRLDAGPVNVCLRAATKIESPIDGKQVSINEKYCGLERGGKESWHCGLDGQFFEEKV
jgi:hypothetical protein